MPFDLSPSMTDEEVRAHVDVPGNGTSRYRLERMERDLATVREEATKLRDDFNHLVIGLIGTVLVLFTFGIGIAVTLLTAKGR